MCSTLRESALDRSADPRGERSRRQGAIAVGDQLSDLLPVGVRVEHHTDLVFAPDGREERATGVTEHFELGAS
jgi:hypothetical protein